MTRLDIIIRAGRRPLLAGFAIALLTLGSACAAAGRDGGDPAATDPPAASPIAVDLKAGTHIEVSADPQSRVVSYGMSLTNNSTVPVQVVRLPQNTFDGLHWVDADPPLPLSLPAGKTRVITLSYHVDTCPTAALADARLPLELRVNGARQSYLLPMQSDGPTDPWSRFLARPICAPS